MIRALGPLLFVCMATLALVVGLQMTALRLFVMDVWGMWREAQ